MERYGELLIISINTITMNPNIKFLKKEQNIGKQIAIYCAGTHGLLFAQVLEKCQIKTDIFFDSNNNKWGEEIYEGIFCANPYKVADKNNYIVFICIAPDYYEETQKQVQSIGFQNIVNFNCILDDIILNMPLLYLELIHLYQNMPAADLFYTPLANNNIFYEEEWNYDSSDKIAIYTGIFGDYDKICEPQVFPENIDYYFISDNKPENLSAFQWIDAQTVIPSDIISPIKRNRYIKMHPHLLFPEYKYSIYIDGNIIIKEDITSFIKKNLSGIAAFMHPRRDCLFYEAITIVNFRRVVADDVCKQMKKYLEEGMPLHYGLPEMPVIAREHYNPLCIQVMETWWKEFDTEAQRDQLSFMYAMWKNGLSLMDMSSLGNDAHKNEFIAFNHHFCESKFLFNEKNEIC